jgi:hypothetical protein
MLLALKLTLVPALIACVTLAGRRWGPWTGGLLTALPVVAGPALGFYAVEQGREFTASAAQATLLGLVAVTAFCVVYGKSASKVRWYVSLLAGWLAFAITTFLLLQVHPGLVVACVGVIAAVFAALRLLPRAPVLPAPAATPRWDLPMRMLSAASLVLLLTSVADQLGPKLSGALTPFPVATAVVATFTHAQNGSHAVTSFFRGLLPGLMGFALFCVVLTIGLREWSVPLTFALAILAQLVVQAFLLFRNMRAMPPLERASSR